MDPIRLKTVYHQVSNSTTIPETIQIKEYPTPFLEKLLLGHWEACGYRHKVSGTRRILAAITQTAIAGIVLWGLSTFVFFKNTTIKGDEAVVGILALTSAIFAGCLLNERSSLYSKSEYLSDVFNQITDCDQLEKKLIHKVAAYGYDCLILEMWAHKSFRAGFIEAIIWGLILKHNYDKDAVSKEVSRINKDGIKYKEAKELISELIWQSSPI